MSGSVIATEYFDAPGADIVLHHNAIQDADRLLDQILSDVPWEQQEITVFNRKMPMPRLTCWMGEASYTYSNLLNLPAPWLEPVAEIRDQVSALTEQQFNGALLNLYRDGKDSMGWHADDEKSLGESPLIPSVNLGATRRIRFKPRKGNSGDAFGFDLPHGSVLMMQGATQQNWLHTITKTAKPVGERINITLRSVKA